MLTSRQPIWIGWGRELIYLYNDPYKSIIGGKHPWALGRPTSRRVARDLERHRAACSTTAMSGDEGTYVEAQLLIMERNGYPEETYYTFSYSPIPTDDGTRRRHLLRQHRRHPARDRRAPADAAARAGDGDRGSPYLAAGLRAQPPRRWRPTRATCPSRMIYMAEPGSRTAFARQH